MHGGVTVLGEPPDAAAGLADLRRVLKSGGALLVSEHWSDPGLSFNV
jgi:predicted methyltransferase